MALLIVLEIGNDRRSATTKEAIKKKDNVPKIAPPSLSTISGNEILKYLFLINVRTNEIMANATNVTTKKDTASDIPLVSESCLTIILDTGW